MRAPADRGRRRRRSSGRIGLIAFGVIAFFGLTSLRGIAGFWTSYLWFQELGLTSVWKGVLGMKIVLVVVFTGLFFVLLLANLVIADRLAPRFRAIGPEDELVQRYRQVVGPHAGKVRLGVSVLFALMAGTGVSAQWHNWLLYRNAVNFGIKDPQFGRDVGYFVFKLPFLSFLVDWAFVAIVIVAVVTVVAHYLNGGIRIQAPMQRVTPQVKAHISVLLACLALIKAVGYYLQRFELSFSTRGVVDGATYSDVKAQLPALELLVIISIAAALMLFANIRRKGWALPVIGVGLWALISVVVGAIVPAFVQKFTVQPSELARERVYIERNLKATREAFGLTAVEQVPFGYDEDLTAADLQKNAETVRNVRLWDPQFVGTTFKRLQELRSYYRINDVDIDRYRIEGRATQTIVSARELNSDDLPSQSWVNQHLSFTHGFGALVAPANAVTSDGQPNFTLKDIPPSGVPQLTQPRIYYGENTGGYAVVNTKQKEIDFQAQKEGTTRFSTYNGTGGVRLNSVFRRAAFALRFADVNMMISSLITPESRAIFVRDIGDRVRTAAPFLRYDADPYPVVVGGKLLWVQDAYTTTSRYPYSQRALNERVPDGSGLAVGFNYARNSVKVVTDAFNGTMTFYVVDGKDPIIKAYEKAFPKLFTPGSKISDELRSHLRYPEDLFRVQSSMYGRYHITAPDEFYNAGDAWDISQDPGSGSPAVSNTSTSTIAPTAAGGLVNGNKGRRMDPTYLLLRLPGEASESFLILQPFVPRSQGDRQQNLSAFMVAKSDPGEYGKLQAFVMPRGEQIDGPALVDARAAAAPEISSAITQFNQQGSEVKLGNVQVIPIETSLLYVRPMYVQSARNPLPEFKRAIVVFGNRAVIGNTLAEALTKLFGNAPATQEEAPGGTPPTAVPGQPAPPGGNAATVQRLLGEAQTAYDAAQAALKAGDLAEYQKQINTVGDRVRQAQQASGAPPAATPDLTTTTSSTSSTTGPTA